jgi:hypothetical protein
LTNVITSPAFDRVVVQTGAGIAASYLDGKGSAASAQIHGRQSISHLAGTISAGEGVAQAEFTREITSPAFYGVIIRLRQQIII